MDPKPPSSGAGRPMSPNAAGRPTLSLGAGRPMSPNAAGRPTLSLAAGSPTLSRGAGRSANGGGFPGFPPPFALGKSAGPAAADGRSSPSKRAPPNLGDRRGLRGRLRRGRGAGRLGLGGARRGEVGRRRREIDVVVGERRDRRGLRGRRSGLRRGQRRLHRGERLHDRRRRGGHRRQVHQLVDLAERRRRRERDGAWRRGGGLRGGGLGRGRLRRARLLGRRRLREQIVVDVESAWAGRRRGRRGRQDGRGDTHDGVLRHRRRGDRRVRVVHGERVTALRAPHL